MKIQDITAFLEEIAPLNYQEDYDNAGLVVGHPEQEVTGVLCALDAIESVIDEAISLRYNLVVAHHPIVFRGLKKFNGTNYIERCILKAIKNDIAIYAIHTNLDNVLRNGVNAEMAQHLGIEDVRILAPKYPDQPDIGAGLIGTLSPSMSENTFLSHLKQTMKSQCVRHTRLLGRDIRKVALCGGSGRFLLEHAIRAGADIFISADFKYHEFFDANDQIVIADIGHYESEQYTIDLLQRLISEKFSTFATRYTNLNTNPINYF